jgi:hypothetical protein
MAAAFPIMSLGRLPRYLFRGLLDVHWRYGLHTHRIATAILSTESFGRLVAYAAVSIVTGCNDYFPDGTLTRWTSTPLVAAHDMIRSAGWI